MIRKDTTRRLLTISIASVLVLSLAAFTPVPVYAPSGSTHVAVIGTLSSASKGDIPSTNAAFNGFTFTLLTPGTDIPTDGDFSSACEDTIANPQTPPSVACDTIVIFMPTPLLNCNLANLSTGVNGEQESIDLARQNGIKLIIYDSECASLDYDTLISNPTLQFDTNSGGAFFGSGTTVIVEQNVLSSNADIDVVALCETDACGDSNVLTSTGTNLCVDMTSSNNNIASQTPVHVYSKDINALGGLLVYNGYDMNPASPSSVPGTTNDFNNLAQLFLNELNAAWQPSGLLCGTPVVQQVGGDYVSLDSTSLFVSGLAVNALWMLPMLAAGGVGAGVYFARGKFHKVEN